MNIGLSDSHQCARKTSAAIWRPRGFQSDWGTAAASQWCSGFAEGEIAPHVMEWDEASHFPTEIMPKLAEMGLLGVIFPEQYGGAGLGYLEYVIAVEELSRVDGSGGIIVARHHR